MLRGAGVGGGSRGVELVRIQWGPQTHVLQLTSEL